MPGLRHVRDYYGEFDQNLSSSTRTVTVLVVGNHSDETMDISGALASEPNLSVVVEATGWRAIERLQQGTRGLRPTNDPPADTPYQSDVRDGDTLTESSSDAAEAENCQESVDCVLYDCATADPEVFEFIESVQAVDPSLPVILLADEVSDERAVAAIERGADDVLQKEPSLRFGVLTNRIRTMGDWYQTAITMQVFYQTVEHAGHSIYITTPRGVIEYANPAFEAVTGFSREEAIGRTPAILNSGVHDEGFYADLWETITKGEVWENEIVNERKSGERYYADQTITPLTDGQGEIRYFIAINNEITELKDRERELEEQNERLESFASLLSHDLRNPLTVAQGYLDIAEETGDPENFERVREAHERMNSLIEDALILARQGRTLDDPGRITLVEVISDAWDHVSTPEATLECVLSEETRVVGDQSRLCELFENLFRNAVEHVEGTVTITVGERSDGSGFYVADDGPGIPEEVQKEVFETGFTTVENGTGLGLSIVEEIAIAHEWTVSLGESTSGGACFRFEIPPDRWEDGGTS